MWKFLLASMLTLAAAAPNSFAGDSTDLGKFVRVQTLD